MGWEWRWEELPAPITSSITGVFQAPGEMWNRRREEWRANAQSPQRKKRINPSSR
jgi:hypothetical protein